MKRSAAVLAVLVSCMGVSAALWAGEADVLDAEA